VSIAFKAPSHRPLGFLASATVNVATGACGSCVLIITLTKIRREGKNRLSTATVALPAGGALKGGRVLAAWPGLKEADLYKSRDLKPTTDLRAVLKGLLEEHLRADPQSLEATVFPDSGTAPPVRGLLA
jgi:uncharacterized protein (DUF1501 family)